jgi:hypothetical protein
MKKKKKERHPFSFTVPLMSALPFLLCKKMGKQWKHFYLLVFLLEIISLTLLKRGMEMYNSRTENNWANEAQLLCSALVTFRFHRPGEARLSRPDHSSITTANRPLVVTGGNQPTDTAGEAVSFRQNKTRGRAAPLSSPTRLCCDSGSQSEEGRNKSHRSCGRSRNCEGGTCSRLSRNIWGSYTVTTHINSALGRDIV